MKKILMILAPQGYQDHEFQKPYDEFKKENYEITIASKNTQLAQGILGGTTKIDKDLKDIIVEEYDAIVFIGGPGAKIFLEDQITHKIIQTAKQEKKLLAGICMAPAILANAGVLLHKKATIYPKLLHLLDNKAIHTGKDVEIDENIITANGPNSAQAFGETIVRELQRNKE
jgi:protease I